MFKRGSFFIVAILFLLPHTAGATGFAKQSLFLSKSVVTEGDTVRIHAVVSNDDGRAAFTGTLSFTDGSATIGNVPVSLAGGEAGTVSISWKPTSGTHSISADLKSASGSSVEQESATFSINGKPQLVPAQDTALAPHTVTSSQEIQRSIASFSPLIANTSKPVFSILDNARTSSAKALDSGVAWSKGQLATAQKTGRVLGAENTKDATVSQSKSAGDKIFSTLWLILATVALYILSILRYVIGNAGVFYPVLAVLFLYILWRLFRRFGRRSRY